MARAEFEGSLHFDLGKTLNIGLNAFAGTDFYGLVDGAQDVATSYYSNLRRPGMFYGYKEHSERSEGDHVAALSVELRARLGRLVNLLGGDYYVFLNGSVGAVRVADGADIDFFPLRMSYALGAGARITDNLGILGAVCLNYDEGAANPWRPPSPSIRLLFLAFRDEALGRPASPFRSNLFAIVRPLQLRYVELLHREEGFLHSFGFGRILVAHHFVQDSGHDLPGKAELVLQPPALLGFGVGGEFFPEIIDFFLILAENHQRLWPR